MAAAAREVDVVVVGAGTAGIVAHKAARKAGARAVLVDRGPLGTTCARVGCMPSKLLIAAAEAAHAVREAPGFGVRAEPPRVDGPAVLARVRRERDRFVGDVLADMDALRARDELVEGTARLVGPDRLRVDDSAELQFRGLVVATGTTPTVPAPYRGLPTLTSDSVFELPDLPASVLVVGSGAVGLELGQALHRLGVRVTVLGRHGAVGPLRDPAVRDAARACLADELEFHPDHELGAVEAGGDGVVARYRADGAERSGTWERVLVAAGRRPNTAGLGLELAGVELDERGFPAAVDLHTLRAGATRVYFAGDVAGLRPLMHEAGDDGFIAGGNAATPDAPRAQARRAELGLVFTDPGMAVVGGGAAAAPEATHARGEVEWSAVGRARILRRDRGLARVYASRADRTLAGAELLGPHAEHLGHLLAWAVQQRLTVDAALAMPFYHPTLEEGLRTALQALKRGLARK